ncbi:DUF1365 domain-containing protein [Actinosynnema sp. NPDC050801]|uniref:DUF1365 domain-containing protein n=1 Tax=unclassified Actinosynnema TaxID=2637065 RepID=UPI0033F207BF
MTTLPAIYRGHLVHIRRGSKLRVFRHRLDLWCVDLDNLPKLPGWLHAFAKFDAADHLGAPHRSIRANVDHWLAERDIDLESGRITMLTSPRVLGYVFNPLTVYWCHRPDGSLACVIAEVTNTYAQRHCYLLTVPEAPFAEVEKEFYVSPFFEVAGQYRMRLPEPGERLSLTVSLVQNGRVAFTGVMTAHRHDARARDVARFALTAPLMPQRVSTLIRWHGVLMWAQGMRVVPRDFHS